MGAATPSKRTRVPPAMTSNWPGVTVAECDTDGPRFVPKIVISSPGAIEPGRKLAAFTTPDADNVGGGPCNSVNVNPAMAMLPARGVAVLSTEYVTTPVPIPLTPDWIV